MVTIYTSPYEGKPTHSFLPFKVANDILPIVDLCKVGTNGVIPDLKSIGIKLSKEDIIDKVRGLIYGQAIGDAMGLATEFMGKKEVDFYYRKDSILHISWQSMLRDRHRSAFSPYDWTDDTDQLLLLLECFTESRSFSPTLFAQKLAKWGKAGFPTLGDTTGQGIGQTVLSVITHPEFLQKPHVAAKIIWEKNNKNVASNGAVMRTAIIGVPHFYNLTATVENAVTICKTTHYDERCVASCVAISVCVAALLRGLSIDEAISVANTEARNSLTDPSEFSIPNSSIDNIRHLLWK